MRSVAFFNCESDHELKLSQFQNLEDIQVLSSPVDDDAGEQEHTVKLAATHLMSVAGVACFHTSVIVDDFEYFFDSLGIMVAPPLWSHLQAQAKRGVQTEVIDFGTSSMTGLSMAEALRPHFTKSSYDLLYKNCNHFSDAALYCLNRSRLEGRMTRMERFAKSTDPISTTLMNNLFKSLIERRTGEPCDRDIYVTNPLAKDFSLEQVFADLEEEEESEEEDEEYYVGCAKIGAPPCFNRDVGPQPLQC